MAAVFRSLAPRVIAVITRGKRSGLPRNLVQRSAGLEHDPEKWVPVFPKRSCSNKKIERDDDSKKSHPALGDADLFKDAFGADFLGVGSNNGIGKLLHGVKFIERQELELG